MNFPGKKALSVFRYPIIYHRAKNRKNQWPIPEKNAYVLFLIASMQYEFVLHRIIRYQWIKAILKHFSANEIVLFPCQSESHENLLKQHCKICILITQNHQAISYSLFHKCNLSKGPLHIKWTIVSFPKILSLKLRTSFDIRLISWT